MLVIIFRIVSGRIELGYKAQESSKGRLVEVRDRSGIIIVGSCHRADDAAKRGARQERSAVLTTFRAC